MAHMESLIEGKILTNYHILQEDLAVAIGLPVVKRSVMLN